MISLLTIFSRISDHCLSLGAAAVIVDGLNPDLIGRIRGGSRHDKLGPVSHIPCRPVLVHVRLSPLDSVLQTRPVGLKTCQRLCGDTKKTETFWLVLLFSSLYLKVKQQLLTYCPGDHKVARLCSKSLNICRVLIRS